MVLGRFLQRAGAIMKNALPSVRASVTPLVRAFSSQSRNSGTGQQLFGSLFSSSYTPLFPRVTSSFATQALRLPARPAVNLRSSLVASASCMTSLGLAAIIYMREEVHAKEPSEAARAQPATLRPVFKSPAPPAPPAPALSQTPAGANDDTPIFPHAGCTDNGCECAAGTARLLPSASQCDSKASAVFAQEQAEATAAREKDAALAKLRKNMKQLKLVHELATAERERTIADMRRAIEEKDSHLQACQTANRQLTEMYQTCHRQLVEKDRKLLLLENGPKCKCCWENDKCVLLFPCKHVAFCESCHKQCEERGSQVCYICKQPIMSTMVIHPC